MTLHESDKTSCHLCGGHRFHLIEELPIHLVICPTCSLIFIKDIKGSHYYKELYQRHYGFDFNFSPDSRSLDRKNAGYVRWIKRCLNPMSKTPLKLLEIGCGSGHLLRLLKNEQLEVYGIEPAEEAVRYARKNGLEKIENCFLEETHSPDAFFDTIVLIQTLEHFIDPSASLLKIRDLLKDNGLLFIEVPDAFSLVGVYRWGLEPSGNHLFIYSVPTLKLFLNKCGFEIVDLKKTILNIRVVARKGKITAIHPERLKNFYKKFLVVNSMNKQILKIIYRLRIIEKIQWIR